VEQRTLDVAGRERCGHTVVSGSPDLGDEFVLHFEDIEIVVAELLGYAVEGAEGEGLDRVFGSAPGQSADHDDGQRRFGHDALEGFEAVQTGHVEVERDDVGMEHADLHEGLDPVFRSADDTE
jgi:hypothetical protein